MMRRFFAQLLAVLAAIFSIGAHAVVITGRVTDVKDGDTVYIVSDAGKKVRIRVAGIDAPETDQPYGSEAKNFAANLVAGRHVTIDARDTDRYGRIVGSVAVGDIDLGYALIRAGLAWHYKQYSGSQPRKERAAYAKAERQARREGRGLWDDGRPEAPWDHRHAGARSW